MAQIQQLCPQMWPAAWFSIKVLKWLIIHYDSYLKSSLHQNQTDNICTARAARWGQAEPSGIWMELFILPLVRLQDQTSIKKSNKVAVATVPGDQACASCLLLGSSQGGHLTMNENSPGAQLRARPFPLFCASCLPISPCPLPASSHLPLWGLRRWAVPGLHSPFPFPPQVIATPPDLIQSVSDKLQNLV